MPTRVVNLHRERYDVYIGRAGHGEDGYFGNPIARGVPCVVCGVEHLARAAILRCYREYFSSRIETDAEFRARVEALRGLTLGCFCRPLPCHGDIIAAWLDVNAPK